MHYSSDIVNRVKFGIENPALAFRWLTMSSIVKHDRQDMAYNQGRLAIMPIWRGVVSMVTGAFKPLEFSLKSLVCSIPSVVNLLDYYPQHDIG